MSAKSVEILARLFLLFLMASLTACNPKVEALNPKTAAYWLDRTCGVSMAEMPSVLDGTVAFSMAPQGTANYVNGSVAIAAGKLVSVSTSLANNTSLAKVVVNDETQRYESHSGAAELRTCVLNSTKRTLFFEYRD